MMGVCHWQVLALARKMMDGRSKQDILDSSYHRYAFHDTGVPKWFYEDERRHMRCVQPLSCYLCAWACLQAGCHIASPQLGPDTAEFAL